MRRDADPPAGFPWDRIITIICGSLLLFGACFAWGFAAAKHRIFPYPVIARLGAAAEALQIRHTFNYSKGRATKPKHEQLVNLWYPTDETTNGVVVADAAKYSEGATLFSDSTASAYLMAMDGTILHEWHKAFSDVWPDPQHIFGRVPDGQIYWRRVHMMPNGDLLAIYEGINQVPYGGGLIKVNRDSELIWKVDINAHHDLDIGPDGSIYVLTHVFEREGPRISDFITVLSPEGEVLKETEVYDALNSSLYMNMVPRPREGDYLHCNSIELLGADKADAFPSFGVGDILVSYNALNAITVIDRDTHIVKWALSGLSREGLHDADFQNDGRIRFFDNKGHLDRGVRGSRIMEYNVRKQVPTLVYADAATFKSENRGSQQLLANGNTLITESTAGTLFEVTPDGEIVWKYVSDKFDGVSVGVVNWAQRIPSDELTFLKDGRN